jgi:hypothetical protein
MSKLLEYWPGVLGYLFGVVLALPLIQSVTGSLQRREGLLPSAHEDLRGSAYMPRVLGLVERALFIASIQASQAEFIGVWLALKVAGQWRAWSEGIVGSSGRTVFSIFLVGSGMSVAYAFVGAKMIEFGSSGRVPDFFLLPAVLLGATAALRLYIPRAGSE